MMKFLKKDSMITGVVLSAIVPWIIYIVLEPTINKLSEIFTGGFPIIQEHNIMLVSIFLNMVIFYPYIHKKDYDMSGRGVLIVTFIYTAIYLVWRFKDLAF